MWFSCFPVLPGSAEAHVIWGGTVKRRLIAYVIGNISAKNYQNPFMCVKVIASQRWDVFWDTVYLARWLILTISRSSAKFKVKGWNDSNSYSYTAVVNVYTAGGL